MSEVTAPSPSPRRVTTPRWLDVRLILGVVLVLGSVLAGAAVFASAGHTYRMLSMSRDLAAGTILRDSDVTAVKVRLPDHGDGVYLAGGTSVAGKALNRAVTRGELLPAAALGTPPASTTVTVPFQDGTAPDLRAGQRIEMWLSTKSCPSVVLISDVTVQAVDTSGGSAFSSGSGQNVVIGLAPALAQRVVTALALDSPVIRAGVLAGPIVPGVNDALPDLAPCVAGTGSS